MREQYDLKKLKVKRRSILPDLRGQRPEDAKRNFLREVANNIAHLPIVQRPGT